MELQDDGSYLFRISRTGEEGEEWFFVHFIPKDVSTDNSFCSYYSLLGEKGAENPLQVTQQNLALLERGDATDYYRKNGYIPERYGSQLGIKGQLGKYLRWDSISNYWHESSATTSSVRWETVVGLSDAMLVSLSTLQMKISEDTLSGIPAYIAQNTGISFTTVGDADLDGKVDAVDALAILQHAVQKSEITDTTAFLMSDSDQNDLLDAKDALNTLCIAVGK